jgi:DNA-binding LacI/PurR family transcriptional regulator
VAATLHDVARIAGVSIKTVSNVVNGYAYIKPTTRARVLQAIEEVQYKPNLAARNLRSGRSGVIGLIMPDLRNPYFAELAGDVMRAADRHGLAVLIEQVRGDRESEIAALQGSRMQTADGILYRPLALDKDDVGLLDSSTPMVLLGDRIFNGPTDHVTIQNVEGARAATQHLLDIGKKRILAIGAHEGETIGSAGLRLQGYRSALHDAGIAYDPALVLETGTWHRADGARLMRAALASEITFDSVFAFNDSLALGAVRAMQEDGIAIPQDIAIIGFDDIDETRYSYPTLTTVDPGRAEIAVRAVDALVERISSSTTILAREIPAAFRVIVRESTGG